MKNTKTRPEKHERGFYHWCLFRGRAKAAITDVCSEETTLDEIEVTLPIGKKATFSLEKKELYQDFAICSVIKDAGDDLIAPTVLVDRRS